MSRALLPALFAILTLVLTTSSARAAEITLTTADQRQIHAVYEGQAKGGRGVLLIHGEGRSATDWKFLVPKLSKSGFKVLAVDLRGHGGSAAAGGPDLSEADWLATDHDVKAALDYLLKQGVTEPSVIGAGVGANLALRLSARQPDVRNLILLSPGLSTKGLRIEDSLKGYGSRPLLIVVSQEDTYSAKTALLLYAEAMGRKHMQIYNGAGNGALMLNREPTLEGLIGSWLQGTFEMDTSLPGATGLRIGGDERIETTGPPAPGH
jgi:acetyl esterase/lipase